MGIAEVCFDINALFQSVVLSELGSIIEGNGLPHLAWQGGKPFDELCYGWFCVFSGLFADEDEPCGSFICCENDLSVLGKSHQVAFPMSGYGAIIDGFWSVGDGGAVGNGAG